MVPGAIWPGSDQRPWGTATASGPAGWLGRPSVSDPWGLVCCDLYRGYPGRARVCGVHGSLAAGQHQTSQACTGRNGNGVHRVGDTMVRHARRRPCPQTKPGLYHHATDRPTLTNYAEPLKDRPTNHNDLLRTPGPPGERKLDRVRRRECAPRHASPVARASSSRLTPTENQPRWGCLQDRAFGLAPGPWAPESGG